MMIDVDENVMTNETKDDVKTHYVEMKTVKNDKQVVTIQLTIQVTLSWQHFEEPQLRTSAR